MKTNKLVSQGVFVIALLGLSASCAYAEYYVVCTPPAIQYIETISRPACHIRHYHHVHHRYHYRPLYSPPKSHAEISVYYVWDMYPAVCSCCPTCSPCSYCSSQTSDIYFVPASRAYIPDEYDGEFDFDRRTADDIGNNVDVDY